MPIYEYECTSCHHHFDFLQKISDEPLKQCPQCFEQTAVRLVSAPGFQLKGSGWYATDFKNKDTNKEKKTVGKNTEKKATESATPAVPTTKKQGESD